MSGCLQGFVVDRGDNTREISPRLAQLAAALPARRCRVCGCTQDHGCVGGCWWVDLDLCSRCRVEPCDDAARRMFGADLYWAVTAMIVASPGPLALLDDSVWERRREQFRWLRALDAIAEEMVNS